MESPNSTKDDINVRLSLEYILYTLPVPICAVNKDMHVFFMNQAWEAFTSIHDHKCPICPNLIGSSLIDHLWEPVRTQLIDIACKLQDEPITSHFDTSCIVEVPVGTTKAPLAFQISAYRIPELNDSSQCIIYLGRSILEGESHYRSESLQLDVVRQLARTLNHEINNPLQIIGAVLEDQLADETDTYKQYLLRGALDAVFRVSSAIKTLQEIRRIVITNYVQNLSMVDLEASQSLSPDDALTHESN